MAAFFPDEESAIPLSETELAYLNKLPRIIDDEQRIVIVIDDMLFPEEQLRVRGFFGHIWTDSRVFYNFSSNVSSQNRARFVEATLEWSDVTNIVFTERTTEPNYIFVQAGSVNNSFIGMIGGRQVMNIVSWTSKFVIVHELGHALGLGHEQSRSDRDNFVIINSANINSGAEHNFDRHVTSNYTPYDFSSIMHYDRFAFSSNGLPTISAQSDHVDEESNMGNRSYMTSRDAAGMYIRYGRP